MIKVLLIVLLLEFVRCLADVTNLEQINESIRQLKKI